MGQLQLFDGMPSHEDDAAHEPVDEHGAPLAAGETESLKSQEAVPGVITAFQFVEDGLSAMEPSVSKIYRDILHNNPDDHRRVAMRCSQYTSALKRKRQKIRSKAGIVRWAITEELGYDPAAFARRYRTLDTGNDWSERLP